MHFCICGARSKRRKRKAGLGKLHRVRYLVPSFFSQYASPRRDTTRHRGLPVFLHLVLPVCSLSLLPLACCLPPVTVKHERGLVLRGWRQGRQMGIQRRCHVCSVYPAAREFAFGSTCMRALGEEGAKIMPGVAAAQSSSTTVQETKEDHYRNLRGDFPPGQDAGPRGDEGQERERAWRLFYFQQSGKCLAAHCPAPGGPGAAIPHEATDSKDSLDGPANAAPAT